MKAYIFDLDGTLLDSMKVWEQIDVDFLAKRGFAVPPGYMEEISASSFPEAAACTIRRFGLSDSVEELLREWNDMAVHAYGHTVGLKPFAREYLAKLKACGAKLGIATSLPAELYEPALQNHGIREWFDAICSVEEGTRGKESPDIFLLAAERLGVEPAGCVVFEDVLEAVRSAKAAGMTVYGVYDESSRANWEEIGKTADGVLCSFADAPLPQTV